MINATLDRYWDKDFLENLDWPEFQKYWPLATPLDKPDSIYGITGPCRISYDEANAIAAMGIKLTLEPLPGAMLTKMVDAKTWEYGSRIDPIDMASGTAVQITVPDMPLMYISEVEVLDDACTNVLQDYLDKGWRILAVCPPNSQRRPDYILGRVKPKGG